MNSEGKLKKKLIITAIVALCSLFLLGALALVGTGLFAVYTLVSGVVDQLPEDLVYTDGTFEDQLTKSDLSGYDLDKMIEAAADKNIFTDDMLDALFMERDTFQHLLQRVKEYNETFDEADKSIGKMHYWYETETEEGPPDKDGNPTTISRRVKHTAEETSSYHVTAANYEDHYYQKILWQSLYVSAVADVLTSYQVQSQEIQEGGSVADNTAEAGELVTYASGMIGKSYTNLDFVRNVFSHFQLELPLDAKTIADAFADPVGQGTCRPLDDIKDKLQNGDILCFAAKGSIVTDESTLARTYVGSGEDITIGIYIGNDTVLISENGIVKQANLSEYSERFYSARRTAMSEDAKNTVEIEGQEVIKSDGYTGNRIGDYVGNWVGQNDYERSQNEKYTEYINEAASLYNLPPDLIRANISAESGWNPDSKNSTSTASGLMQIVDRTWNANCVQCGYPSGDYSYKCDPRASIMVGAAILHSYIYGDAKGDLVDGMGMYHFGSDGYKNRGGKTGGGLSATEVKKLSLFCNKQFTLADLQSGAFDSVADGYMGIGYITTNGRLMLTDGQLNILMNTFKTYFTYAFDVVRDSRLHYSYAECQGKPNYGKKISGIVGEDWYEWYEPVSQLDLAEAPWLDVYYAYLNIEADKVIRHDRWVTNQMQLWDAYDGTWYETLVDVLPKGDEAGYRYNLYKGMAKSVIEYDKDENHILYAGAGADSVSSGIVNGSTIGWASGGGYNIPDGYTSIQIPESAGGMSIPLYLQYDSKWGSIPFGGGNIGSSGCGAASMAMVVTYLTGRQVTPDMIVGQIGNRYYAGSGQSWDMPGGVAAIYGIKLVKQCPVNAELILKYLKEGYPVVVSTSGFGTTQEFTTAGHYIVLRGLDGNGKVLVNDPNDNTTTKQHYLKAYDANFIVSECIINHSTVKPMWVFSK